MLNWFTGILAALGSFAAGKVLPAVIITVIGILAIRLLLKLVCAALDRSNMEKAAHSLIKSVVSILLYVLLGLTVASSLGIDVTGIVALASVLTLAVSLSVQNALTNVIGGFTLLYTKPFVTGHFVEVAGQSGTVKEIGLTYTKLATGDNKLVSIPNSAVVAAQIVNYTAAGVRRVDVTVYASLDTPADRVMEALLQAAQVSTALDTPAPFAGVKAYGESAMEYVLQVWSSADDYWTTLFAVNQNVQTVLKANDIAMTYPHLNVHLNH